MKDEAPSITEITDKSEDSEDGTKNLEVSEEEKDAETREIKKRSRLFQLISIGNATGQSFLFNFFSAFAANVGISTSIMGFITSIRNLMGSIFQGTIGRLSDRYGRKYFLMLGFFLSFSIMIVLVFLNNPIMLIIISIIQASALSIIVPVWNATLGDVTQSRKRAGYIGRLSALGTAVSVSLMLALAGVFYIFEKYSGYVVNTLGRQIYIPELNWRVQYGIAFGLAAFNFLLCFVGALILKETHKVGKTKVKQPSMFIALKDKRFTKFFIINSVYGLIMAAMWPIFPIAQIVVLKMNFPQIAIINAVFSTSLSLGQFFSGKMMDRLGRKPFIIYGRMMMFTIPIIMIGAVLIGNWQFLLLSNILGGSAMGAITVAQTAYVLDIAPEDQMGAYSGLQQVGWGVLTFIGSLSAGVIGNSIERRGQDILGLSDFEATKRMVIGMFIVIAVLRFVASFGFFFFFESLQKEAREALKLKKGSEPIPTQPMGYASDDSQMQSKK